MRTRAANPTNIIGIHATASDKYMHKCGDNLDILTVGRLPLKISTHSIATGLMRNSVLDNRRMKAAKKVVKTAQFCSLLHHACKGHS